MESMTGYTFTPCVGYFTSPGIDGSSVNVNNIRCIVIKTSNILLLQYL